VKEMRSENLDERKILEAFNGYSSREKYTHSQPRAMMHSL
jgi:hypothetical protein